MSDAPQAPPTADASQLREWQQALDDLERNLREASRAILALRRSLQGDGPAADAKGAPTPEARAPSPGPPAPDQGRERLSAFDRFLDRLDRQKTEKQAEPSPQSSSMRKGLELLPHQYLMTVEDLEGEVDLVPLQRALLSLTAVEEVLLVSYANGVPVVSFKVAGELDLEELGSAVSTAMDRQCEVIPQGNDRIYLRMRAAEASGG